MQIECSAEPTQVDGNPSRVEKSHEKGDPAGNPAGHFDAFLMQNEWKLDIIVQKWLLRPVFLITEIAFFPHVKSTWSGGLMLGACVFAPGFEKTQIWVLFWVFWAIWVNFDPIGP